jgi:hypothetical protein
LRLGVVVALQGLAGTPFVTRGHGYLWPSQPNKVDFGVRKVLKRNEASRDCMTSSEHGECCIKMQKFQQRLFYAPLSSEDNIVIENSKDSVTLLRSEF